MNLAALIVSIVAVVVNAWLLNYQRRVYRWTGDGFNGPIPKLMQVRYRPPRVPVSLVNAETAVKIELAGMDEQFRTWLKQQVRRRNT